MFVHLHGCVCTRYHKRNVNNHTHNNNNNNNNNNRIPLGVQGLSQRQWLHRSGGRTQNGV